MPFSEGVSTHKIMFQELKDETNLGKKRTVMPGLKEMGKVLWEGREKVLPCWLSQFSLGSHSKVCLEN